MGKPLKHRFDEVMRDALAGKIHELDSSGEMLPDGRRARPSDWGPTEGELRRQGVDLETLARLAHRHHVRGGPGVDLPAELEPVATLAGEGLRRFQGHVRILEAQRRLSREHVWRWPESPREHPGFGAEKAIRARWAAARGAKDWGAADAIRRDANEQGIFLLALPGGGHYSEHNVAGALKQLEASR